MGTFRRRSRLIMLTIWKSLVQSKLDYTSQLWSPSDQASISELESVARHFTSKIDGMAGLEYWERLHSLHLYSQKKRRERYLIISSGRWPRVWYRGIRLLSTSILEEGASCLSLTRRPFDGF